MGSNYYTPEQIVVGSIDITTVGKNKYIISCSAYEYHKNSENESLYIIVRRNTPVLYLEDFPKYKLAKELYNDYWRDLRAAHYNKQTENNSDVKPKKKRHHSGSRY